VSHILNIENQLPSSFSSHLYGGINATFFFHATYFLFNLLLYVFGSFGILKNKLKGEGRNRFIAFLASFEHMQLFGKGHGNR